MPGASALLAALVASGLPSDRFAFMGFLPVKGAARREALEASARLPMTQIWYEAPGRVAASCAALAQVLGPAHPAVLLRELTKRFEERVAGTLSDLAAQYQEAPPRGECVLVVGAADCGPPREVDALLRGALVYLSVKDAAAVVAAQTGLHKRELYAKALAMAGK